MYNLRLSLSFRKRIIPLDLIIEQVCIVDQQLFPVARDVVGAKVIPDEVAPAEKKGPEENERGKWRKLTNR